MKKLVVIFVLVSLTLSGMGQSIFKPVPRNLFEKQKAVGDYSIWLPRISAGVSAVQFTYNKETKKLDMAAFSKVGLGLSYAHYIMVEDKPYNNFSLNGFVFFPTEGSGLSLAATVSFLQYLNLGAGYDWFLKKPFALTGVTYTF